MATRSVAGASGEQQAVFGGGVEFWAELGPLRSQDTRWVRPGRIHFQPLLSPIPDKTSSRRPFRVIPHHFV